MTRRRDQKIRLDARGLVRGPATVTWVAPGNAAIVFDRHPAEGGQQVAELAGPLPASFRIEADQYLGAVESGCTFVIRAAG